MMKTGCSNGQNTHPALACSFPVPHACNDFLCNVGKSLRAMSHRAGRLALGWLMPKQSPHKAEPEPRRFTQISLVPKHNPRALPGCPQALGHLGGYRRDVVLAFHATKTRRRWRGHYLPKTSPQGAEDK